MNVTLDLAYRAALLLLLVPAFAASIRLRRRADRAGGQIPRSEDPAGVAVALRITGATYYGSVLLWLVYPPALGWSAVSVAPALRWTGILVTASGLGLAVWSLRHLGSNVTPTAIARPDAELVDTGPYRRVRHPLYSSMFLTVPGIAMASASLVVLVAGAAMLATIVVRTRAEEKNLERELGEDYRSYVDATGRFFPRFPDRGGGRSR
ncbi:MAG TPA: isoprenylcysteine carboxylmethyltransferase family protein [Longimicrobiales bacterium]|nr:isoprenylcysteine carboxylmethyltransferase family protein [Longimicrobiales bacterium]